MLDNMSTYPCPNNEEASNIIFNFFKSNKTQNINFIDGVYNLNYSFFDENANEKYNDIVKIFNDFIRKYIEKYRFNHSQGSLSHWHIFESKEIVQTINESILNKLLEKHNEPKTPNNTPRDGIIIMEEIERDCYEIHYMFEFIKFNKSSVSQ